MSCHRFVAVVLVVILGGCSSSQCEGPAEPESPAEPAHVEAPPPSEEGPDPSLAELVAGLSPHHEDVSSQLMASQQGEVGAVDLSSLDNLVTEASPTTFHVSQLNPLVALAAPLEGWLLYIETTELSLAQYRLHLIRRDLSEDRVLDTRRGSTGPCDGAGWSCQNGAIGHCNVQQLEAEGRLCVEPMGISLAALTPDRSSLVILGHAHFAGENNSAPFNWVVDMPAGLIAD